MKKNQKKIVGTLLGLMASISGTKAVPKSSIKGDINAGITSSDNKDGKQSEFTKRNEANASLLWLFLRYGSTIESINEIGSTVPGFRKITMPWLRQLISSYRIVYGFSGYVNRHDNPSYNNVFKLSGDDGHDFRVRVDKGDDYFVSEAHYACNTSAIESAVDIDLGKKFKLSEFLSEPYVNLVAEARTKDAQKYYRLFEAKKIWTIDDVAYAIGQANKLIDIINDPKMDVKQKKDKIINKFGKNVVFVPVKKNDNKNDLVPGADGKIKCRILLGKKKFPILNVREVVKEKFFAGGVGGDVDKGFEHENNKDYVDAAISEFSELLKTLDQSKDLNCYAEFELIPLVEKK